MSQPPSFLVSIKTINHLTSRPFARFQVYSNVWSNYERMTSSHEKHTTLFFFLGHYMPFLNCVGASTRTTLEMGSFELPAASQL